MSVGLLLQGDCLVQLVVLCAEKPNQLLLKRVAAELPVQLSKVCEDHKYSISMAPLESAVLVSDGTITVKVSLTSPLLRDSPHQGICRQIHLFWAQYGFAYAFFPKLVIKSYTSSHTKENPHTSYTPLQHIQLDFQLPVCVE